MSDYFYLEDSESDMGMTPVPSEEMVGAIREIARKEGVEITDQQILEEVYGNEMEKDKTQLQSRIPDLNQLDGLIVHEGIILDNELISYKFKYAFTNYEEFYASLVEGLLLGIETTLKEYDPKAYSIFTKIREASQL